MTTPDSPTLKNLFLPMHMKGQPHFRLEIDVRDLVFEAEGDLPEEIDEEAVKVVLRLDSQFPGCAVYGVRKSDRKWARLPKDYLNEEQVDTTWDKIESGTDPEAWGRTKWPADGWLGFRYIQIFGRENVEKLVMDELREVGCLGMVTTHLSVLKAYALNHERVDNASVEFDTRTMSPTYHLRIGTPGESHALAVAKRLGLGRRIVTAARRHMTEQGKG